MIRVFLADDHTLVREGLKRILSDAGDMTVVGEAADGAELYALALQREADLVVADLAMPGRPMLEVLKELRAARPKLNVLVLSMYPEEQYAVRALQAGAAGYLNKGSPPDELLRAIRGVAAGRPYISAAAAATLARTLSGPGDRLPHEVLSNREFEVLRKLAAGRSVGEIATDLCLSVKTISTFRTRILAKLQLQTNADLTRYALQHQLID
jgi:DNA-binding NarL/FixJ family response regulator